MNAIRTLVDDVDNRYDVTTFNQEGKQVTVNLKVLRELGPHAEQLAKMKSMRRYSAYTHSRLVSLVRQVEVIADTAMNYGTTTKEAELLLIEMDALINVVSDTACYLNELLCDYVHREYVTYWQRMWDIIGTFKCVAKA